MIKDFFKLFDKDRFMLVFKIILFLVLIVFIVNIVGTSYSKYSSEINGDADASVAFFINDIGTYEETIALEELVPSPNPFYYTFYVSNYEGDNRSKVTLDYTISFETTTNLPLSYRVVRNETFSTPNYTNIITSSNIITDSNGVYYNHMNTNVNSRFSHTTNMMDSYVLEVTFPESNKYHPNDYQGKIELFSVIINTTQTI